MKKAGAVFFLIIIGLTIVGFFPLFKFLQFRIRQEMKMTIRQGLPEEKLFILSFSEGAKLDWTRKGHEFRYNNQMFDVVKQKTIKGRIIYWCINDEEEEQLLTGLDNLVKKQMDDENSPFGNAVKILLKVFSQLYFSEKRDDIIPVSMVQEIHLCNQAVPSSVFAKTETPPPKFV